MVNDLGRAGGVAASERITMGAIGIGGRGRYVMGALMGNPEVQMVAVCDARGERRQKAKEIVDRHNGNRDCATYIDLRDLLARDDIDAVMVATGENWHAPASILAARAGKDIYSEKPPAHTIAEGRALAETVKRYGTVYQCGTQRRSIPRFRFAVELARSGKLGQLRTVYAPEMQRQYAVLQGWNSGRSWPRSRGCPIRTWDHRGVWIRPIPTGRSRPRPRILAWGPQRSFAGTPAGEATRLRYPR